MQTQPSQNDTPLPRAIRRQMDRMNQRIEARSSASNTAPPPPATDDDAGVTNGDTGKAAHAQAPAAPAPAPAPAAADPRENDPGYWKARFKVTEGMLRKAQEDLRDAQAEADQTIQELRNKVAELQAAAPASTGKVDITAFFTPEQIDQFGTEQCEAMATAAVKAARSQADELIKQAVEPIKKKAEVSERNQRKQSEDNFWNRLAELTPDYQDINADAKWLAWLAEVDPDTKVLRQDTLDIARQKLNADGVSAMFEKFRASQKTGAPGGEPPLSAPRSGGAGGGGEPPANTGAKGYPTREEIRDFHKRAATIKNPRDPRFVTPQERKEFEARLQLQAPA